MAITKVQQSSLISLLFSSGGVWSPTTTAMSGVAAGNLVITMGAWWMASRSDGAAQDLPTDSNGTLVTNSTLSPPLPLAAVPPGWPVAPQLCYILSASAGTHTFTPPALNANGDGYFGAVEFNAPGATWSLVDSGYAFAGSATIGAVDGVVVNTTGTAAAVGDLVVTVCQTDGDPTALGLTNANEFSNNLITTSTTSDNVGAGASWRIATAPGTQTATWDTIDAACQVTNAVIAVFRATGGSAITLMGQTCL